MKQSLQLKLGQHLAMTPQLQQAIRLLQLSSMELQQEVQDALESNVMLETEEDARLHDPQDDIGSPAEDLYSEHEITVESSIEDMELDPENTLLPTEWSIDNDWADVQDNYTPSGDYLNEYDGDPLAQQPNAETLRNYLLWQLNLVTCTEEKLAIAAVIIDAVNEDGYLGDTLEHIFDDAKYINLETTEIEDVLRIIQTFDPAGVAARDLRECLLIQLHQNYEDTPIYRYAIKICEQHFALLSSQNHVALKAAVPIAAADLFAVLSLLRNLYPYPGRKIGTSIHQYLIPDILVSRHKGVWYAELNPELIPRVRINHDYAKLIRRVDRSADNMYLKNHLQEARWFIKNLANRNETLLKVATKIIELQRDFFEYGHEAMRPLVLRDIAEALEMHESTVSRATSQKYLHSPRGTFELKFFFSSHVNTDSGGQCSATAIRALIKKLIAAEVPESPLSDDMLAKILADKGIRVARRTVAKYRESMSILPSVARKRIS